jgi:hypothetical protein
MADTKWKLNGTYFETCNCEVACPCIFLSNPTDNDCTLLVAWHIDNGSFDNVKLDGLNIALAVHSPGHMAQVKWDAAVYVDDKANEAQKDALLNIFSGQAGGHPALLSSHVGNILGVKSASIEYKAQGKNRSLKIDNIAEAEIEAISGQGGAEVSISNHPLCIAPGYPAVAAKSKRLTLNDYGLSWNVSGKNGFYSPFSYSEA